MVIQSILNNKEAHIEKIKCLCGDCNCEDSFASSQTSVNLCGVLALVTLARTH